MKLQANSAGVSRLDKRTLQTSQLAALRLIHKYPSQVQVHGQGLVVAVNGAQHAGGYVGKMKTVDTPAECHRLSHASCRRTKEGIERMKERLKERDPAHWQNDQRVAKKPRHGSRFRSRSRSRSRAWNAMQQ